MNAEQNGRSCYIYRKLAPKIRPGYPLARHEEMACAPAKSSKHHRDPSINSEPLINATLSDNRTQH